MDNKKTITFGGQEVPFKGIDRTASSNDSNPGSARVLRDMEINPIGKLVRRNEHDALYDDRPSQYEHTTDDAAAEGDQLVVTITDNHTIYRSHRRKLVAVGHSGTTEYRFTIYVEISESNGHVLKLERGVRSGVDIDWEPVIAAGAAETLDVFALATYDASDWIESSMRMNADEDTLYVAVSYHDASAPEAKVDVYEITNLYVANFTNATISAATNFASDTHDPVYITRDLDIEYDDVVDIYIVAYGFDDGGDVRIKMKSSATGSATAINTVAGKDIYSISLVVKRTISSGSQYYLAYTQDEGDPHKLYYRYVYCDGDTVVTPTPSGSPTLVASNIYESALDNYLDGACFAIDDDDSLHFLYKTAAGTLAHSYKIGSGSFVTTTASTDLRTTAGITHCCWDIVVKDGLVTIFHTSDADTDTIYKRVRIVNSDDEDYGSGTFRLKEIVRADPADLTFIRDFGTYRTYEINTSKCLSFVAGTSLTEDNTIRYLHEDKGLFDADFDGNVTDTADRQVAIEALAEPMVSGASGTISQILIIQCDDDKLYKRGHYQWDLLEGQRNVDNTGWNWVTDYGSRCNIWDKDGTVRFNAGNGTANQNAWYSGIFDRYFFINLTTHRYNDHYSELARLDPPPIAYVTAITETIHADAPVGYGEFLEIDGDNTPSRIFHKYKILGPGDPAPYAEFYLAFSYEYDGYQESQLRVQNADTTYKVGAVPPFNDDDFIALLKISLELPIWNKALSPLNVRITAIHIYMGEPTSDDDTKLTVQYDWVKRVQISATKETGEDPFGDTVADDIEGKKIWTVNGGDATLYDLDTYIDYNHWMTRTLNGAKTRLDNSNAIYKSTGSGTEVYTKECFVPEGYEHAVVVNNEVWVANIRLAGVTRTNRLMRSARRLGSQVTPDHLTDDLGTIIDLPYDIKALGSIGDRILVVVGSHGTDIFDVGGGVLIKMDEVVNIGTNATYSVTQMMEGGIGNIIKGLIFKDTEGNVRLCDGYGAEIISDGIFDDHNTSNRGIDYLNDNATAQFAYLPHYRKLILAYGTQVFVLDLKRGLRDFYDWRFGKSVDALCVGVDGELFFTEGIEVHVYPQAGTEDTPDPQWRSQDITFPDDIRLIAKKVWMDYLCNWSSDPTLKPYVYKDTTEVASTNKMAKHTTQQRDMTGFAFGTAALREMAFGFKTTTPANLTSLEVDKIAVETLAKKRRPQ